MAYNSQPLELNQAIDQLVSRLGVTMGAGRPDEVIDLTEARGRILSRDVHAPINLPPFRASAMDGYAIQSRDLQTSFDTGLTLIGTSLAGHPATQSVDTGSCVRIYTGAKVPDGADCILLQEDVLNTENGRIRFKTHVPSETYVRPVGHDIRSGNVLAQTGQAIDPFCMGSLSAAGIAQLRVFKQPVIGVFSTGDELVDPGTPPQTLEPGQIYDSNRLTVLQLLRNCPCELRDLGRLADDATVVRKALAEASRICDVLITSGGVSVSDADFVTNTIRDLGELEFWKLNLKPGKPMAFGRINDCWIFGLPGNPVSTIITLLLVARPAILTLAGAAIIATPSYEATLANDVAHTPGRTEFQRGTLRQTAHGWLVGHTGDQSSNRLRSFADANCLIEIPHDQGDLHEGERVQVLLLDALY